MRSLYNNNLFAPGHTACTGCGEALGVKLVLNAAGPNTIATCATGCLEVFSSRYPQSSWEIPWIHSLFENAAAVASGIAAALKAMGREDEARVIAQAGDGGTADIGLQSLSGMLERGDDVLYICYDNEAYMNTGVQRSGLTPLDAHTTTSPAGRVSWGNKTNKKDMPAIAAAHHIPYLATASVGYPQDLQRKVKKALSIKGPKYLHLFVPCPLGWGSDPALTIKIAKLVVETGLFPLYEMENGRITKVKRLARRKPVVEYLKLQRRFSHLFKSEEGKREIERIQAIADELAERFGIDARKSPASQSSQ